MSDTERIEQDAAAWLARLDARPSRPDGPEAGGDPIAAWQAASPDFARWIGASIDHRVAFLRLHAAWRRADRLAALRTDAARPMVAARPARPRKRALWIAAVAASLVLAFAASLVSFDRADDRQTFETAVGGHETVPLVDGSRLELNTGTRLTARISDTERRVVLEHGEAYFEVTPDPARPFVVEAGDRRVTVLGTRFTVRHEPGAFEVVVAEGRVRIDPPAAARAAPTIAPTGTHVLARGRDTLIAERTVAEISAALGWRQGLLIFDRMDLARVADEFNRYNRVKLVIEGADTGEIRIGGSFKADNVEAFARLLRDGFGLTVDRRGDRIVIKS